MNNRTTLLLASLTGGILLIAIVVGVISSHQSNNTAQPQQPSTQQQPAEESILTAQELANLLETELPGITSAFNQTLPTAAEQYTIDRGRLYEQGQWYGTTLTYKGADQANRDTLRVIMQKKDGRWIVRTTPPQPLLNKKELPDVPITVIKSLNQPAPLPGTETSPAID